MTDNTEERTNLLPNDKTKWPYLAALIDGEGTISLGCYAAETKAGTPYIRFDLQINVAGTSLVLMGWLSSIFGGNFYKLPPNKNVVTKQACYQWKISGQKRQETFLLNVLPYLVIKKEQAKIALEYIRLPYGAAQERMGLKNRMSFLNGNRHVNRKRKNPLPTDLLSVTTNTSSLPPQEVKIESDLTG